MKRAPIKRFCLTIDDRSYALDEAQLSNLNQWLPGVIDRIDEVHRRAGRGEIAEHFKQKGEVYAGASGGNLTFSITPTSIGTVFKVAEALTGETVDLSDYDNW